MTREQLLDTVWQRRMVNDEVLSRAIADLRRALDDDARQPVLIETLPKLGYRLLVPVRPLALPEDLRSGDGSIVVARSADATRGGGSRRWAGLLAMAGAVALMVAGGWLMSGSSPMPVMHRPVPGDFVHVQPLVAERGIHLMPRFSSQGDLFAYSVLAEDRSHARLHVRSRDRRIDRVIANDGGQDVCPLFSRDGADLLWTRHQGGECRVLRMALAGGVPRVVTTCLSSAYSCPDLGPDGQTLVFSDDGEGGLAVLGLADGQRSSITQPEGPVSNDADPRWSPDGRRIAFLRGRSSDRRLMVLDVGTTSTPDEIVLPQARTYGLVWLDNRTVMVATDSEGTRALVAVDVDTGRRDLLGGHGARRPDRAPDGAIAWEVASYRTNLSRLDADGDQALTDHRRSDGHQVLSPDGTRLVFQSNREGPDAIWLLDLASGDQRRLPLPTTMRWVYPAWLPDGSGLVLVGQSGDVATAWRYRFNQAVPERLDAVGERIAGIQQADDATLWYLREDDDGRLRLWRLPSGAHEARLVAHGDVQVFRLHRDGVYFQPPESNRLWLCNRVGEGCREMPWRLPSIVPATWALSDEAVFFQQPRDDGTAGILRASLAGDGLIEETSWSMPSVLPNGLAVAADGGTAYVARATLEDVEIAWLPPAASGLD